MNENYLFRHWLITLLAGSFFLVMTFCFPFLDAGEIAWLSLFIFILSLLLTIPCFFIYRIIFIILEQYQFPVRAIKAGLTATAIALIIICLCLIFKRFEPVPIACYAVPALISGLLLKLQPNLVTGAACAPEAGGIPVHKG